MQQLDLAALVMEVAGLGLTERVSQLSPSLLGTMSATGSCTLLLQWLPYPADLPVLSARQPWDLGCHASLCSWDSMNVVGLFFQSLNSLDDGQWELQLARLTPDPLDLAAAPEVTRSGPQDGY